jgi:hypothetical protein
MDKKELEQRIQQITQSLQASNIGTNKTFLHINGKENDVITNKNAKIQYKLNNPIKLDIGDRVTLYQAFVNEAGLSDQTITFQEDLTETMNFMYYMPSQTYSPVKPKPGQSSGNNYLTGNTVTNSVYAEYLQMPNDLNWGLLSRKANSKQSNFTDYIGGVYLQEDIRYFHNGSNNLNGDCGQVCYLFENYIKDDPLDSTRTATTKAHIKPAIGTVTFTIKAGNYSAESLARLITEQINGSIVNEDENYLTNRLYNPNSENYAGDDTRAVFGKPQNGITTNLVYSQKAISGTGNNTVPNPSLYFDRYGFVDGSNKDFQLKNDIFVCADGLDLWERAMKQTTDGLGTTRPVQAFDFLKCNVDPNGNIINEPLPEALIYGGGSGPSNDRLTGKGPYNIVYDEDPPTIARANMIMIPTIPQNVLATIATGGEEELINLDGKIPNRYIGTHSFSIDFSKNRSNFFSLQNLHEPYKLPSIDQSGSATSFGGQQSTKYSPPMVRDNSGYIRYPIEASMGIMVTNFCFNSVKTTKKYIDDLAELNAISDKESREYLYKKYLLDTRPFQYFYATESEAKKAFNDTIWARLGFGYDQLGDFSDKLETIKTQQNSNKQGDPDGVVSKFGFSNQKLKGLITHNSFDFSDIQASSGLGPMVNPAGITSAINVYGTSSYNKNNTVFEQLVSDPSLVGEVGESLTADTFDLPFDDGTFHLLTNSQTLDAETLPSLNAGNAYYLIHSDIIKRNGFDANSEPMNLIGVMSKENSSNDTIFSVEGVENIVTEEKLMTELTIEIKNTDGTIVPNDIIGADSGFILLIEKAIAPDTMPLLSI